MRTLKMLYSLSEMVFVVGLVLTAAGLSAQEPGSFWTKAESETTREFFLLLESGVLVEGKLSQFAGSDGIPEQRQMEYLSASGPEIIVERWRSNLVEPDSAGAGFGTGMAYVAGDTSISGKWECNPRHGAIRHLRNVEPLTIKRERRSVISNLMRYSNFHDLCLLKAEDRISKKEIPAQLLELLRSEGGGISAWSDFAIATAGGNRKAFYVFTDQPERLGSWMCWLFSPDYAVQRGGVDLAWDERVSGKLVEIKYFHGSQDNPYQSGIIRVDRFEPIQGIKWALGEWLGSSGIPLRDRTEEIELRGRWLRGGPSWREPVAKDSWIPTTSKILRGLGALTFSLGAVFLFKAFNPKKKSQS